MRQITRLAAIGTTAGLLAGLALAQSVPAQGQTITVSNAWARRAPAMGAGGHKMDAGHKDAGKKMDSMQPTATPGGGGNGAVYATLGNAGAQSDSLVAASTDVAQTAELHETKSEGGVMKMRPVPAIPVPAKGKTELKPGGYHIMLMGLKRDLKPGETIPVTLKFERGGEVRIEAAIK